MPMQDFIVFGYARTKLTDEELRDMISKTLTCRIDKKYTVLLTNCHMSFLADYALHSIISNTPGNSQGKL